jgi:hypothetical protein
LAKVEAFLWDNHQLEMIDQTGVRKSETILCGWCGAWFVQYDKRMPFCLNCCQIMHTASVAEVREYTEAI